MAESRATIPTLDLAAVPVRSYSTAELTRACALALREHPRANAAYRDGHFELYSRINVGVVLAHGDLYLIPTVFDADSCSLPELEAELTVLRGQAMAGRLAAPRYGGATFTLWNAGEHGLASASIPVVSNQAAALAAGTAALTLTCDHRILYGATAAAFVKTIAHHLDGSGV